MSNATTRRKTVLAPSEEVALGYNNCNYLDENELIQDMIKIEPYTGHEQEFCDDGDFDNIKDIKTDNDEDYGYDIYNEEMNDYDDEDNNIEADEEKRDDDDVIVTRRGKIQQQSAKDNTIQPQSFSGKMKWNVNHIVEFLKIYQQYPQLWNIKDKDYCSTKLKFEIYQRLFCELNEKKLIMGMNMKQLKSKIKSIKDVYRQEVHKIKKSKKSGCSTDKVYFPKLAWFNEASFLAEVFTKRSSESNLDLSQYSPEAVLDENSKSEDEKETLKNMSPAQRRPPAMPIKKAKKRPFEKTLSEISKAIKQLDKIAQNPPEEKPYDQFGKLVASELHQLPPRHAILLQQEIQNGIICFKLACQDPVVRDNAFTFGSSSIL